MATQWYWRVGELELGPVSFPELTSMVRDHVLNEDDLVRPDHLREWQTADTVVGLFYMARRTPAPRQEAVQDIAGTGKAVGENDSPENASIGRSYRLDQVARDVLANPFDSASSSGEIGGIVDRFPDSTAAQYLSDEIGQIRTGTEMASAIDAAAEDWDRRHAVPVVTTDPSSAKPRLGIVAWIVMLPWWCVSLLRSIVGMALARLVDLAATTLVATCEVLLINKACRLLERIASRQELSRWFRTGCATATAVAVAWAIVSWSEYEDLRFPDASRIESGTKLFPVYGRCLPVAYWFMLVDISVVGAVVGYFGARGLESLAEN